MKNYEEALNDIKHSMAITFNQQLIMRLVMLKVEILQSTFQTQEALNVINEIETTGLPLTQEIKQKLKKIEKQVQNTPNKWQYKDPDDYNDDLVFDLLPAAKIVRTEEKGRHMIAQEIINAKQLVMKEKPFVNIINQKNLIDYCNYCIRQVTDCFVACHHCSLAVYCNEDHRAKAWQRYHQFECPIFHFGSSQEYQSAHLAFRILFTVGPSALAIWQHGIDENQAKRSEILWNYKRFLTFLQHRETQPLDRLSVIIQRSLVMAHLIDNFNVLPHDELTIKKLFSFFIQSQLRIIVNGFGVAANDGVCGVAICIVSAMINHSCNPNVSWRVKNGIMKMVTNRKVEKDNELMVSYGYHYEYDTFLERQLKLKRNYHFTCHCDPCNEEAHRVKSLKCLNCSGPVVWELDGHCYHCNRIYENFGKVKDNLIEKKFELQRLSLNAEDLLKQAQEIVNYFEQYYYPCNELAQFKELVNQFVERFNGQQKYLEKLKGIKSNEKIKLMSLACIDQTTQQMASNSVVKSLSHCILM